MISKINDFKSLSLCMLCMTASSIMSACVTSGQQLGRDGSTVLEKSRPEIPNWVQIGSGSLQNIDGVFHYVEIHTKGRDLPLALNHAQVNALAGSSVSLAALIKENIQKQVKETNKAYILTNSDNVAQLTQLILTSISKIHGNYAKVADIFYEKLQQPQDQPKADVQDSYSYDIYVLIKFPAVHLQEVYNDLKNALKRSRDPKMKDLLNAFNMEVMAVSR